MIITIERTGKTGEDNLDKTSKTLLFDVVGRRKRIPGSVRHDTVIEKERCTSKAHQGTEEESDIIGGVVGCRENDNWESSITGGVIGCRKKENKESDITAGVVGCREK